MKKIALLLTLMLLLLGIATHALAVNGCVCVGGKGIEGCGNGAPTETKGRSRMVQDGDVNKYLTDQNIFAEYWSKGEGFDKNTGWVCKRY